MQTEEFIEKLKHRLSMELPASAAHQKMMRHRKPIEQMGDIVDTARKSAVLALLYPKQEKLHTVFILRPSYDGVHSGQIGFPGGKAEDEDKNLEVTALREANEELNIQKDQLEVLGALSPLYVPPSNFLVHPFIAYQHSLPKFIPQKREVEKVIECPLTELSEGNMVDAQIRIPNGNLKVKGFQLDEQLLWGATAMIVKEMMEVLEEITIPNVR